MNQIGRPAALSGRSAANPASINIQGAGSMLKNIVDDGSDEGLARHADRFQGRLYRRAPAPPFFRRVRLGIFGGLGAKPELAGTLLDLLNLSIGRQNFSR